MSVIYLFVRTKTHYSWYLYSIYSYAHDIHLLFSTFLFQAATFQDVRDMFSEHVEVRFVNVPRNRETGKVKGFAFVDVGSEEDIAKAVEALRGAEMEGRPLRISKSLDKDQIRSTKNNGKSSRVALNSCIVSKSNAISYSSIQSREPRRFMSEIYLFLRQKKRSRIISVVMEMSLMSLFL